MNKRVLIATVIAVAVLTPTAVMAATGSFSSGSSTTALTAVNSGSGKAISASSKTGDTALFTNKSTSGSNDTAVYANQYSGSNNARGVLGYANNTGTGVTYGVYGRTNASGELAAGVKGYAANATGYTAGVLGLSNGDLGFGVYGISQYAGVIGTGGSIGVFGETPTSGDGSYGVWSLSDLGVSGHLVGYGTDVAGQCTVTASTTQTCAFDTAFPSVAPIVVLTPTSNPGGAYWVSTTTADLTITLAVSGTVTFNYVVVGIDSTITPLGTTSDALVQSRLRQMERAAPR